MQYPATSSPASSYAAPSNQNGPGAWADFHSDQVQISVLKKNGQGPGSFTVNATTVNSFANTEWRVAVNGNQVGPVKTGSASWSATFNQAPSNETAVVTLQWKGGGLAGSGSGTTQIAEGTWIPGA
jgi:carbon monoxide dehydrogenase subunit G